MLKLVKSEHENNPYNKKKNYESHKNNFCFVV